MRRPGMLGTVVVALLVAGCAGADAGSSPEPARPGEYASPAAAFEAAQYVVTADIKKKVGTADFQGVTGNVYSVSTTGLRVWKGDDVGLPDLRVLSTPATDGPEAYPQGDPLGPDLRRILFLTRDSNDGMWRTLSAVRATLPATTGDTLPESWPPA